MLQNLEKLLIKNHLFCKYLKNLNRTFDATLIN